MEIKGLVEQLEKAAEDLCNLIGKARENGINVQLNHAFFPTVKASEEEDSFTSDLLFIITYKKIPEGFKEATVKVSGEIKAQNEPKDFIKN